MEVSSPGPRAIGAGAEERQAALEVPRQALQDGLEALLDAETARKVVEAMARNPGFGRRRGAAPR